MRAASKARSVVLVLVTALANVAMIAISPAWRHGIGGVVSLALMSAVIVLARGAPPQTRLTALG
jgi:hypothetical protein